MSYRLIIRPEAELDIQDAFEWYDAQTLGLGSEFVRAVDACLSGIGRNPLAYPIIYKQARRLPLAFTVNVIQRRGKVVSRRRSKYRLRDATIFATIAVFDGARSRDS